MSTRMVRAQILLPKELLCVVRLLAKRRRVSMTAVVREALRNFVAEEQDPGRSSNPFGPIIGLYQGGTHDSVEHDEIVYGLRA